ncbi:MAG: helix-turn-helix transcriptional regulator [Erysipelotrichaceae bacterium]|nr:helix-turn-helix transcriptional regulator [Erysipelotrichaceae bacterium]
MQGLLWETPEEINLAVANRLRGIRKRKGISQERLAEISGVSFGSIKRFESTGQISFVSLTRLAVALNLQEEIKNLFTNAPYLSIEEVLRDE